MVNTKLVRTRSRPSRTLTASKRRRLKTELVPELRGPMTREIEQQLEELVSQFGEKKVLEALDPLVSKCKWNDWQCVANAIRRIARDK